MTTNPFDENWLSEYEVRTQKRKKPVDLGPPPVLPRGNPPGVETRGEADPGPESDLQSRIEDYCDRHAFPYFHDRSKKVNEPGFPDLVIGLPLGVTLWLELKSKAGRLSKDQKRWRLMLLALNHIWYECRSYRRFLEIITPLACRETTK